MFTSSPEPSVPGARVVVVGAGGNIGSQLVPHLARLPEIASLVLIDRGVYDVSNVITQAITCRDAGRQKVEVQADLVRQINPELVVTPLAQRVEDVPLGAFRSDVLLACLDSRAARQVVNQAACRLGIPWVDAGVHGEGLLARVNVYVPGPDRPCLECAWDERDYAAIEQEYPCGAQLDPPATNASSALGALAAALQAIECGKLLAGRMDRAAVGQQVLIDASSHRHYVTTFRRNPGCRRPDHEPWTIEPLGAGSEQLTIGAILERRGEDAAVDPDGLAFGVPGSLFVRKMMCASCHDVTRLLALERSLRAGNRRCVRCDRSLVVAGFDRTGEIDRAMLSAGELASSLASIGIVTNDVVSLAGSSRVQYFEVDVPPSVTRLGRRENGR